MAADLLQALLGALVIAIAVVIWRTRAVVGGMVDPDALARMLKLEGRFTDPADGTLIDWKPHRTLGGFAACGASGFLGGVFGMGSGVANGPARNPLIGAQQEVA